MHISNNDFSPQSNSRCLIAALSVLVLAYFAFPVAMALGYVSMALAFVLGLFAWKSLREYAYVLRSPLVIAALGLYVLMLLGWAYTPAPLDDVRLHFSKYAKLLLVPVFILLLQNEKWRQRCVYAFMAAMGFILVSAYANIFFQLPWSSTQNLGWGQDHTVIGDYITQNIMMVFFAILLLEKAVTSSHRMEQAFFATSFVLAVLVVTHLSNGRTGYLLLIVALGMYALKWARGWKQWLTIGVVACVIALSLASSERVQHRVEQAVTELENSDSMEITSIGGRYNFWKYTLQMTLEKPLQGWGTGSYHSQWCEHVTVDGWCGFGRWHPHNQYLFFWMEHGLLGLALFVLFVVSPIWMTRKMPDSPRRIAWCFSALFAVNSMINASLFSSRESHFFVMMTCLACAGIVLQSVRSSQRPT